MSEKKLFLYVLCRSFTWQRAAIAKNRLNEHNCLVLNGSVAEIKIQIEDKLKQYFTHR